MLRAWTALLRAPALREAVEEMLRSVDVAFALVSVVARDADRDCLLAAARLLAATSDAGAARGLEGQATVRVLLGDPELAVILAPVAARLTWDGQEHEVGPTTRITWQSSVEHTGGSLKRPGTELSRET